MKTIGFFIVILLTACGGSSGGSDNDFIGAAENSITVSPNKIDTGDRIRATIKLKNVYKDGIMLKVKYPQGIRYINNSGSLGLSLNDKDSREIEPSIVGSAKDENYLVYFINPKDSRKDDQEYYLKFEYEATQKITDGEIEVDADIDDPNISNLEEFSLTDPEFLAESSASIKVEE